MGIYAHGRRSDRRMPPNRFVADRQPEWQLPKLMIGRAVLSESDVIRGDKSDIVRYLDKLAGEEANKKLGRVPTSQELFVEYVSPLQMNEMMSEYLGGMNKGRNRRTAPNRVQQNISDRMRYAREDDAGGVKRDLEEIVRANQGLEAYEKVFIGEDPGPYRIWGNLIVEVSRRLVNVGNTTIAARLQYGDRKDFDPSLRQSYLAVKDVLSESGLNTRLLDENEWQPRFPLFYMKHGIPEVGEADAPVFPGKLPTAVVLGPIKLVNLTRSEIS